MTTVKAFFNGDLITIADSEQELIAFLENAQNKLDLPNPIVVLEHENGNKLYVGLSVEGNHLAYIDSSMEPPYYSSSGDTTKEYGDEIVEFRMSDQGHVTEILRNESVSFDAVERTVRAFFRSGHRPVDAIVWKED